MSVPVLTWSPLPTSGTVGTAPLKAAQALLLHRGPGEWRNINRVVRVKCLPMVTPPAPKTKGFMRQAGVVQPVKWKVFR